MSWTVACFCGTVFHPPPDRCPTCHTRLPDVSRAHPIDALEPSAEVALEHVARLALPGGRLEPRRPALARRRRATRSRPLSRAGWTVAAGILALAGLLQLALSVLA